MLNSKQEDMFATPTAAGSSPVILSPKIILSLVGLGPVPSLKNQKRSFAWIDSKNHPPRTKVEGGTIWLDKRTIKLMARPLTEPAVKAWMDAAIRAIELQLRSALAITDAAIQTVADPRSWIASFLPLDDSWTWCPEYHEKSELCEPGQEGITIEIERIS